MPTKLWTFLKLSPHNINNARHILNIIYYIIIKIKIQKYAILTMFIYYRKVDSHVIVY